MTLANVWDHFRDNDLWNDVDSYTLLLYNDGIDLTKRDFFTQTLLADLLSWHTWDCFLNIGWYLGKARRVRDVTAFAIAPGFTITPPLILCYLTTRGSYYDISTVLNLRGRRPVLVSIGNDVDFIGDGDVNCFRAGAEFYNALRLKHLRLSPFVYVDSYSDTDETGFHGGLRAHLDFHARLSLEVAYEYSDNDIMENAVRYEDEGANLSVQLRLTY